MKIIVNKCHGGFRLSDEALKWLIDNKAWTVTSDEGKDVYHNFMILSNEDGNPLFGQYYATYSDDTLRVHPDVIECVEALGEKANSRFSDLKIVEIPDDADWEIDEYDGYESVRKVSEVWG